MQVVRCQPLACVSLTALVKTNLQGKRFWAYQSGGAENYLCYWRINSLMVSLACAQSFRLTILSK
jgi:hypothetical protein